MIAGDGHDGAGGGVLISRGTSGLRRGFRPVVWVVFEDVALDAVWRDGRLVASTSARSVAEHLGVDPGTAASALRTLRERGLLSLEQDVGRDGRFGLAVYTLWLPPGVEVISPCATPPDTAAPDAGDLGAVNKIARRQPARRRTRTSTPVEQGSLDLGWGER